MGQVAKMFGIQRRRPTPKRGPAGPSTAAPGSNLNKRLTQLRSLLRRRWQTTVFISVALTGSLYVFALRPANAELSSKAAASNLAESRASKDKEQFETLQSPEGAIAASATFARALDLGVSLPLEITPLGMLQTISTLAAASGLELGATTPAPESASGPAEGLWFYSFSIVVEGNFSQIMDFVEGMQSSQPLVSVYSAKFSYKPATPESGIAATVLLEAEVRFWASDLEQLSSIKANLDAKSRADRGLPPAEVAPATTSPPPPTIPAPSTTVPSSSSEPLDLGEPTDGSTIVPAVP